MLPLPKGVKTVETRRLCGIYFIIRNEEIWYGPIKEPK